MKILTARRNGFTLLEMIVAMGLIAIFTSIGVVSFQASSRRQRLAGNAARVRQIYVAAKANALSGKKNCRECGATGPDYSCGKWNNASKTFHDLPLLGWEVLLDPQTVGGVTVWRSTVQGVCGNGEDPGAAGMIRFTMTGNTPTPEIISGITITATAPVAWERVVFRPSGGGIHPSFKSIDPSIVIRISDIYGNFQRFSINGAGEISQLY